MRPRNLANNRKRMWDVIGHEKQARILQKSIQSGKIGHAYLIIGPPGIGKMSLARYFVNEIIAAPQHLIQVDVPEDKKTILVEQIREARTKLSRTSFSGSYNVCLINNAQAMTDQASNALLKTLEEPRGRAVVVLLAVSEALPETVRSRCQVLRLLPVPRRAIYDYAFGKTGDRKLAKAVSSLALNRPDKARQLLKRPKQIEKIREQSDAIMEYLNSSPAKRMKLGEKLLKKPDKVEVSAWELVLRDALLVKNNRPELVVNNHARPELDKVAGNIENDKIKRLLVNIRDIKEMCGQNSNYKLLLENFLINI